ncbi:MAG: histidinol-phosphate transaminase [SAR86 cluster bacterium]|uniref:Histidinol-phosphate aminotransferase n=1 Tax=SAR86 cluster bacterium TaxID=2030880 RepID=A0A2A5C7D5_9GAMM|nr:MAG: histidinol-phosphate transaminase [SAR86 cluster bacterium]
MTFERKNVRNMVGYIPGEQPGSSDFIKLNTNENPFAPGPAVQEALAAINVDNLRRYPQPTALELRTSIAAQHTIGKENIIVTNGGDELLRLAISTFVETDEAIAVAEPTYTLYEVLAQAHGCNYIRFTLNEDWSLPVNFAKSLNNSNVKMCLLPNPHAPSGTLMPVKELAAIASEFNGILLIDEAYVDFIDPDLNHDCIKLIKQFDNILLLRTFSKGYSLAGLRIAYGIGSLSLINPMQSKTKDSYNIDFIAQKLAQAALEDQDYARKTWDFVRSQRAMLKDALADLGLSSVDSQSNFLLVNVPELINAEKLYKSLKQHGILVRHFQQAGQENFVRITVGNTDENQLLLKTLKLLLEKT